MPRTQDDDFLSTMPDSSKTGVPFASTGKTRGRRTAAAEDDDFLESLRDTTDFSLNPSREGTYGMRDAQSKKITSVPYSQVERAHKSGYVMVPEDMRRYIEDAVYDPKKGEGIDLPEGVVVAGRNTAGQPILAPAGPPKPTGGAARRFMSSAVDAPVGPVKGMYHAAVDAPRTVDEQVIVNDPWSGRMGLIANRLIAQPIQHEAHETAEAYRQGRTSEMLGHGLATVLPGVGPMAAGMGEQIGTQIGTGDYAGAAGTLAGNAAMYAAPEGLGRVARSEWLTRSIPAGQITRLIRPAAADLKFGKDPAAAILSEGIVGNTLEQVGDRVYDRLHQVGKQIDAETLKHPNAVVDVSSSLKPLDDAIAKAVKDGDRNLYRKLMAARKELYYDWAEVPLPGGGVAMRPIGPRNMRVSAYDALQYKRMIGDRIRWTQDPLEGAVNKALGNSYGAVKDSLNQTLGEDFERLNERYSNLVGAAKAVERRLPVEARNAHWSLSDIVLGASGHLPVAVARHVLRTPGVRTRAAAGLYALPGRVPKHPMLITAPATGAAAAAEQLREEAERRRIAAQP
jgi:hypothetical protein